MKKLIYIPVFFILFAACKKEQAADVLTGSWRLTEVYDKSTSTTAYKPAGATSDVVITFSSGQKFSGNTLRNTFTHGNYTISGNNKITFGSYSSTKVTEDSWGGSFSTVLAACLLQSVNPCTPSDFSIQGNILKINTALRYEVTLEKL
jgi:hypothetical protein